MTLSSTPHTQGTTPFPLLAKPGGYVACGVDLAIDAQRLAYWLDLFHDHFPKLLDEAIEEAADRGLDAAEVRGRCDTARAEFDAYLDELEAEPRTYGRLDILAICAHRERVLRRHGFDDPYRLAKQKANDAAMLLLPALLAELDALPDAELGARLIEGVFAGNIFDLGVAPTLELFKSGGVDFHAVRGRLKPRPWLVDHLDRWLDRWEHGPPHRCALLFVDNAGFDIVLGMVPFARQLLKRGTSVIMTANRDASLNDITHDELTGLMDTITGWDDVIGRALGDGRLELVSSGNGVPLIDLSCSSSELAQATNRGGVDLVVLEGMGRALESNYNASFTCDVMKIAMIKDTGVARVYGGEVFDLVFRYDPAP